MPVVATDAGSIGEVVKDGETGRLVRPGDAEALAAAIAGILANGSGNRDITRRANELIAREFNLPQTVSTLEKLIRE